MALAATADIVLFVDESQTANVEIPWFVDTIGALETKLVDRGIGVGITPEDDDDPLENRYSVVEFGMGVNNGWTFSGWKSTVGQATVLLGGNVPSGTEDGIEPLLLASDPLTGVDFEFRNNAAVHYIFFTNGGNESGSKFGPANDYKAASNNDYEDATYGDVFSVLSKAALLDDQGGPNLVADATITFIGGARFDETAVLELPPNTNILGVDVNVAKGWVLSEQADTGTGSQADVFYAGNSTQGVVNSANDFLQNGDGLNYEQIRTNLLALANPTAPAVSGWLDQFDFGGELYSFLAWESGGTYWDWDAISSNQAAFTDLIVKDMFNKIARQVTDFDHDFMATNALVDDGVMGPIGDAQDIDVLFQKFGASGSELAKFDLNGDNTVDIDDVVLLVEKIYATWFGDADLDGDVDSSDLVVVANNWQAAVISWLDGDFNGDGVVNALDLNELGQNWLNGTT